MAQKSQVPKETLFGKGTKSSQNCSPATSQFFLHQTHLNSPEDKTITKTLKAKAPTRFCRRLGWLRDIEAQQQMFCSKGSARDSEPKRSAARRLVLRSLLQHARDSFFHTWMPLPKYILTLATTIRFRFRRVRPTALKWWCPFASLQHLGGRIMRACAEVKF